jgi:hypothetical protein
MLRALVERGAGNSADAIMLRLLWLRQEHPQAAVTTDAMHIGNDRVVLHAVIALPEGAAGSGIAAARVDEGDDWADVVERTETIAISRALDTLGYVLRAATVDAPAPVREPIREVRRDEPAAPPVTTAPAPAREPSAPAPQRPAPPRMDESAPSVVNALRRANRAPEARPTTAGPTPAASEDDAHLEEYSWNTFWSRARELGLTPDKVTEALGRPANQMTPKEAVSGLIAAGAWPQPDGD